jgi:Phage integrase family
VDTDQYLRTVELDPISGNNVARGRHVEGGEVRALFEHLARDPRPIARRDAAALALLLGAGIRRSELAGLDWEDLDLETGRILIRGKGGKERVAWLAPTALPAVRDWLLVRGDQPGPMLNPVLKAGRLQARGLSAQAVYDLCRKLVKDAAILAATPHDWRRTWTGQLLEVADLSTAQKIMPAQTPLPPTTAAPRPPDSARPPCSTCPTHESQFDGGEMVGGPGLEPGWVSPHAPQTCASTSSASRPGWSAASRVAPCPLEDSNP